MDSRSRPSDDTEKHGQLEEPAKRATTAISAISDRARSEMATRQGSAAVRILLATPDSVWGHGAIDHPDSAEPGKTDRVSTAPPLRQGGAALRLESASARLGSAERRISEVMVIDEGPSDEWDQPRRRTSSRGVPQLGQRPVSGASLGHRPMSALSDVSSRSGPDGFARAPSSPHSPVLVRRGAEGQLTRASSLFGNSSVIRPQQRQTTPPRPQSALLPPPGRAEPDPGGALGVCTVRFDNISLVAPFNTRHSQAIRLLGEPWLLELFPSGGQWLAVALRYRGKQQSTHRIMSLWFANDAQEPVLSILSHRPYGFTPYNEWTQQSVRTVKSLMPLFPDGSLNIRINIGPAGHC